MKTLKLGTLALALFAYSFSMTAQEKKPLNFKKMLERFDTNENGTIDFEEWKNKKRKNERTPKQLKRSFERIDSDNSGDITVKELEDNFHAKNAK